jgi:o-succinylbenzoate---CoA ligase
MERGRLAELLGAVPGSRAPRVPGIVCEEDPTRFKRAFALAAAGLGQVFLADPGWGESEVAQLAELTGSAEKRPAEGDAGRGWFMIPTGGTGGRLKFARHDGGTIEAAVGGFRRHFGMERVNAVSVLPLHHVSGFMAWMRCALTGGSHVPWSWKDLEAGRRPEVRSGEWCLSLVPTQLQRLIGSVEAVEWLGKFRIIFIGGGPIWPDLADEAARRGLRISLSYGMTETAAMVAALTPEEFLAGERGCGKPMPQARIDLDPGGLVRIEGECLFQGYYPERRAPGPFVTEDLGEFSANGSLRILGRRDSVIITGGKKADPNEIEAVLRSTGTFEDLAVIGLPDSEWGQEVVACYPAKGRPPDLDLAAKAASGLAGHKKPKRFIAIDPWPRNAQGKVNRVELERLAASAPSSRG